MYNICFDEFKFSIYNTEDEIYILPTYHVNIFSSRSVEIVFWV